MCKKQTIKRVLNLSAVIALCLCLLASASAMAVGTEGTNPPVADTASAQAQPAAQITAPAPLFTEEQAILLVKDSLKADDTWQVVSAGMADNAGATCYRVVATDPIGDVRCRLVNANTGEISVESPWNIAFQGSDNQQENRQDGGGDQNQDEVQNEDGDQNQDEVQNDDADQVRDENQDGEQDESDDDEGDNIDVQQEGEHDTSDELTAPAVNTLTAAPTAAPVAPDPAVPPAEERSLLRMAKGEREAYFALVQKQSLLLQEELTAFLESTGG